MTDGLEDVTVVCVTYRSAFLVPALARTLQGLGTSVIVDNASDDDTVPALRRALPQSTVIARTTNAGFGAANNEAMRQVKTRYALLMNPDCDLTSDDVRAMVRTLERYPDAGAVAPQSWRADGSAQMCFRQAFFEPPVRTPYAVPEATCCARWLHGCCLLVSTDVFKRIGGFDERFFLYYEDDDLCLRMQEAGHACLFEPAAQAQHMGGASSAPDWRITLRKHYHYLRSRHLAIEKHVGSMAGRVYLAKMMLAAPLAAVAYTLLLQPKHILKWAAWAAAAWRGAVDRLLGRASIPGARS
jgi:GT2 family glycosyltransferase